MAVVGLLKLPSGSNKYPAPPLALNNDENGDDSAAAESAWWCAAAEWWWWWWWWLFKPLFKLFCLLFIIGLLLLLLCNWWILLLLLLVPLLPLILFCINKFTEFPLHELFHLPPVAICSCDVFAWKMWKNLFCKFLFFFFFPSIVNQLSLLRKYLWLLNLKYLRLIGFESVLFEWCDDAVEFGVVDTVEIGEPGRPSFGVVSPADLLSVFITESELFVAFCWAKRSCLRNFARRFWNHTYTKTKNRMHKWNGIHSSVRVFRKLGMGKDLLMCFLFHIQS